MLLKQNQYLSHFCQLKQVQRNLLYLGRNCLNVARIDFNQKCYFAAISEHQIGFISFKKEKFGLSQYSTESQLSGETQVVIQKLFHFQSLKKFIFKLNRNKLTILSFGKPISIFRVFETESEFIFSVGIGSLYLLGGGLLCLNLKKDRLQYICANEAGRGVAFSENKVVTQKGGAFLFQHFPNLQSLLLSNSRNPQNYCVTRHLLLLARRQKQLAAIQEGDLNNSNDLFV